MSIQYRTPTELDLVYEDLHKAQARLTKYENSYSDLLKRHLRAVAFIEKVAALSGYVDCLELYKEAQEVRKQL